MAFSASVFSLIPNADAAGVPLVCCAMARAMRADSPAKPAAAQPKLVAQHLKQRRRSSAPHVNGLAVDDEINAVAHAGSLLVARRLSFRPDPVAVDERRPVPDFVFELGPQHRGRREAGREAHPATPSRARIAHLEPVAGLRRSVPDLQ